MKWLSNVAVKLCIYLLDDAELSDKNQELLTSRLLATMKVFPLRNVITFDQAGGIYIKGEKLDMEKAVKLRKDAFALKHNTLLKIIGDQTRFQAIEIGVHKRTTNLQSEFNKGALFQSIEQDKLIAIFAPSADEELT